jgi:hypothetical protein
MVHPAAAAAQISGSVGAWETPDEDVDTVI